MTTTLRQIKSELKKLPWFAGSAPAQQLTADQQALEERQRATALAEIAAAKRARIDRAPTLRAAVDKKAAVVEKARTALFAAQTELAGAQHALFGLTRDIERVEAQHGAFLRATVPESVDAFITDMLDEIERVRSTSLRDNWETFGARKSLGGQHHQRRFSNEAGVQAVLVALREALREARELYARVATAAEAETELDRLRSRIPYAELDRMLPIDSIGEETAA